MRGTTRDVLGEVAYLQRACELLSKHIDMVSGEVNGVEDVNPRQEAGLMDAAYSAQSAKDHIELATQYVMQWHAKVQQVLR